MQRRRGGPNWLFSSVPDCLVTGYGYEIDEIDYEDIVTTTQVTRTERGAPKRLVSVEGNEAGKKHTRTSVSRQTSDGNFAAQAYKLEAEEWKQRGLRLQAKLERYEKKKDEALQTAESATGLAAGEKVATRHLQSTLLLYRKQLAEQKQLTLDRENSLFSVMKKYDATRKMLAASHRKENVTRSEWKSQEKKIDKLQFQLARRDAKVQQLKALVVSVQEEAGTSKNAAIRKQTSTQSKEFINDTAQKLGPPDRDALKSNLTFPELESDAEDLGIEKKAMKRIQDLERSLKSKESDITRKDVLFTHVQYQLEEKEKELEALKNTFQETLQEQQIRQKSLDEILYKLKEGGWIPMHP